jgi:hypothetical protein
VAGVGLALLVLRLVLGHMLGAASGIAKAALVFLPLWFVGAVVNMRIGVRGAGHSVAGETPILRYAFCFEWQFQPTLAGSQEAATSSACPMSSLLILPFGERTRRNRATAALMASEIRRWRPRPPESNSGCTNSGEKRSAFAQLVSGAVESNPFPAKTRWPEMPPSRNGKPPVNIPMTCRRLPVVSLLAWVMSSIAVSHRCDDLQNCSGGS